MNTTNHRRQNHRTKSQSRKAINARTAPPDLEIDVSITFAPIPYGYGYSESFTFSSLFVVPPVFGAPGQFNLPAQRARAFVSQTVRWIVNQPFLLLADNPGDWRAENWPSRLLLPPDSAVWYAAYSKPSETTSGQYYLELNTPPVVSRNPEHGYRIVPLTESAFSKCSRLVRNENKLTSNSFKAFAKAIISSYAVKATIIISKNSIAGKGGSPAKSG